MDVHPLKWEIVNTLTAYPQQEPAAAIAVVCFLIVVALIWGYNKWQRRQALLKRGLTMSRGDRQRYINIKVGDGVVDHIEDLVFRGEISAQEAKQQYKLLGKYLDNDQLLPRKWHPAAVKNRLQKLIKERAETPLPTPNIPGPVPGENVELPKTNVISFGQQALSRKRKVA